MRYIVAHLGTREVTFADYQNPTTRQNLAGYAKIEYSCKQALEDNLEYVWIDTCNIDKSSSAELSEAINSMFRWYKKSSVCYAFLEDLDFSSDSDEAVHSSSLAACRWFTRGWTLQELIAPDDLVIYGRGWTRFGTKEEKKKPLSLITGIDEDILTGPLTCNDASVARRMSWAARRQTTRTEDASYCLLGIFDVNVPLLYGEGDKAFFRLQEQILKASNDMTILAWSCPTVWDYIQGSSRHSDIYRGFPHGWPGSTIPCGILATATVLFAHSADYVPLRRSLAHVSITAQGFSANLPRGRRSLSKEYSSTHFVLGLNCRHRAHAGSEMSVIVNRVSKNQYVRSTFNLDERKENRFVLKAKLVNLVMTNEEAMSKCFDAYTSWNSLGLHEGHESLALSINGPPIDSPFTLTTILTTQEWDPPQSMFLMPTLWGEGTSVLLFQSPLSGQSFAVFIGRLRFRLTDLLQIVNRYPLRPMYTLIKVPDAEAFQPIDFRSKAWRSAQKIRHKLTVDQAETDGELVRYHIHASLKKDKAMGRGAFYLEVKATKLEKKAKWRPR